MSIDISNSEFRVFRDETDNYFTYLSGNIYNTITKETEEKFYSKRKIRFADNQSVKNKSKIKVVNGFATPFKLKYKGEDGRYAWTTGEMYYIREFELLENGIDEKQKIYKKYNKNQEKPQIDKKTEKLNSFSFNEYGGVTPF